MAPPHAFETQYFMTTTTAQAGEVMSWLEFLLQTQWTDLKVHVTSVTDQWAGMAVSGPKSRAALELAFPGVDISTAVLPHMGILGFPFEGKTSPLDPPLVLRRARLRGLYRSGPWRALADHILASAAPLGIKPYGLEALASLRIEKGHVAGLELDHRTTLDDLGLGRMASKEKDFVGRALRLRPKLQDPRVGAWWESNCSNRRRDCAAGRSCSRRRTRSRAMAAAISLR